MHKRGFGLKGSRVTWWGGKKKETNTFAKGSYSKTESEHLEQNVSFLLKNNA